MKHGSTLIIGLSEFSVT